MQAARVMEAFEPVLLAERPDRAVVVGDVNSTLAGALVAAKLKEAVGCRVAHVEAGLRGGDWRMPEEVNRVLTDRLADLLLTPSADAAENLAAEGVEARRVRFVGNVTVDTLFSRLAAARAADVPGRLGVADAPCAARCRGPRAPRRPSGRAVSRVVVVVERAARLPLFPAARARDAAASL